MGPAPTPLGVDLDPPPCRSARTNAEKMFAVLPVERRIGNRRTSDLPPLPRPLNWGAMTDGQKRKAMRNLTIVFATRLIGISQRELARIYDLPHSRIAAIIKEYQGYAALQVDQTDDD